MLTRMTRLGLVLSLLPAVVVAQDATPPPAAPKAGPKKDAKPKDPKEASAEGEQGEQSGPVAQLNEDGDEVKVLRPQDVAAELLRLKTKADIKVEVTIVPNHGRQVTVKGVVRNGKLIERFVGRRFQPEKNIDHPHTGVRLWWVNNTAGWIFLRYTQVQTIALTGTLTAEERAQIMEALKAQEQKKEEEKKVDDAAKLDEELQKMSPTELESYLLRQYPQEQGWDHEKLRKLKKKQLIDNLPLSLEESVFVSYFPTLVKARLNELKTNRKKIEFVPGSADKPPVRPVEGKPIEDPSLGDAPPESSGGFGEEEPEPEEDEGE